MKTTLNECFPDPLTPAWPVTSNPVTCEARQIYALTAIACCVPGAHVLVLHEQENANLMRSCMTRGFRYVDFTIEPSTTASEVAHFLFQAQCACVGVGGPDSSDRTDLVLTAGSEKVASLIPQLGRGMPGGGPPTSPMTTNNKTANRTPLTGSSQAGRWNESPANPASSSQATFLPSLQNRVVASIRGAHQASPDVLSVLMDAVSVAQVRCPKVHPTDFEEEISPASAAPPHQSDPDDDVSVAKRGKEKEVSKKSQRPIPYSLHRGNHAEDGVRAEATQNSGSSFPPAQRFLADHQGNMSTATTNNHNKPAGTQDRPCYVTHHIPSVHIVLFCQEKHYMNALSERFRSAFALSTRVSLLTMDRAPVLRGNNIRSSSVINKQNLMEVIAHPNSLDSVGLSVVVSGYLRHLLLVLRGSLLPGNTSGAYVARQNGLFLRLLRAAAILFEPPPDALLPIRALPPDAQSFALSPRTDLLTTSPSRKGRSSGTTATSSSAAHHRDPAAAASEVTRLDPSLLSAGVVGPAGAAGAKSTPNFSHVVVSPADVMCLLFPMVAHHFTLRPEDLRFVGSPFITHTAPSSSHLHYRQESLSSIGGVTAGRARGAAQHALLFRGPPGSSVLEELERGSTVVANHAEHSFVSEFPNFAFGPKAVSSTTPSHLPAPQGEVDGSPGRGSRRGTTKPPADTVTYTELKRFLRYVVINYSSPAPG